MSSSIYARNLKYDLVLKLRLSKEGVQLRMMKVNFQILADKRMKL